MRDLSASHNVRNSKASTWLQNSKRFSQYTVLVGREIDDAVGDDYIDGVIGKRDLLDLTPQEFHVLHPRFTLVFVCQRQHLVSHIQAIGFPGRADTFRGQENIYTAARTEIKNHFTGMQIRQRCRIPASERSKQSFLGNLCDLYAVVEVGSNWVGTPIARSRSTTRTAAAFYSQRRFSIFLSDYGLDIGAAHRTLLTCNIG